MTNGITRGTNGITCGTNGNDLIECPHCGSVAEYVSEHAKGKRWAVACTMTSKVAADEGRPMCRCRTPFFRDKGQARDIWNARAAVTDYDFAMAVHDGELWRKMEPREPEWEMTGGTQTQEFWECSCAECGHSFGIEDRSSFPFKMTINKVEVPNFCPDCGTPTREVA